MIHRRRGLHPLYCAATMIVFLLPSCGGGGGGGGVARGIANVGPLQSPDANGLRLPRGYTSRIVARSGIAPVTGAGPWHSAPDGGTCFPGPAGGWIYVSNSEMAAGGGGVTALRFDATGAVVSSTVICSGTSRNCAGGATPWGTYLTCEEAGDTGRVFECDPQGVAAAVDRPALGRFQHEAVTFNAVDGRFYLTEDLPDGRLYRFTPAVAGSVATGTLEVAKVAGGGPGGAVTWHAVLDPLGAVTPTRLQVPDSTPFNGGEGAGCVGPRVHFSTKGDNRIWTYDVNKQELSVLYDVATSPTPILSGVDNIEISADGDVVVAEDGGDMQLVAITPSGAIVPLLQLVGQDGSELSGPAFDPSGTRLYFSSQRGPTNDVANGIIYEVTGPFRVQAVQSRLDSWSVAAAQLAPAPTGHADTEAARAIGLEAGGEAALLGCAEVPRTPGEANPLHMGDPCDHSSTRLPAGGRPTVWSALRSGAAVGDSAFAVGAPDVVVVGVTRYGTSTPACQGPLHAGVTQPVELARFAVFCSNAPPATSGLLLCSRVPSSTDGVLLPALGITLYVDLTSLVALPVHTDASGLAWSIGRVPAGTRFAMQYAWLNTPSCPGAGLLSASDALEVAVLGSDWGR